MRNYYIVTFDRDEQKSYKGFHDDFVTHPCIERWFHYIKSSYIIGTTLSEDEVADHYIETAEKYGLAKGHLVIRVNLLYRQGWLSKDAWACLERYAQK